MNPPNDSVVAHLPGTINATVIECNVFQEISNDGELLQISTTWALLNFRSISQIIVSNIGFAGLFLIGGTPSPSGFLCSTFRNRITVLNFTKDLDESVLVCGTAKEGQGYFNFRVYSKLIHNTQPE